MAKKKDESHTSKTKKNSSPSSSPSTKSPKEKTARIKSPQKLDNASNSGLTNKKPILNKDSFSSPIKKEQKNEPKPTTKTKSTSSTKDTGKIQSKDIIKPAPKSEKVASEKLDGGKGIEENRSAKSKSIKTPPINTGGAEVPSTPLKESRTFELENYPKRGATRMPDPWDELPERTRSYLKLWPYGPNQIINRTSLAKLESFFIDIKDLPLPKTVWQALNAQHDLLREMLELIPMDELEKSRLIRYKDEWEAFFPSYECKCHTRKRRGVKTIKKNKSDDNDD